MISDDDLRHEVAAEMASLLHTDERATKTLDSNTLRAPISDLQLCPLLVVSPDASVAEAVAEMIESRQGCVLVMEKDHVAGIFTERDVLTRVVGKALDAGKTRVGDVMSPDPELLTDDVMVAYALNYMDIGGYRHVPIVDAEGHPQGVLSVRDVLHYLAEFFPEEVLTLPHHPHPAPPLHGG